MKAKRTVAHLLLLSCALIWGFSLVVQRQGVLLAGPYTFNACRMLLGMLVMLPFNIWLGRRGQTAENQTEARKDHRALIWGSFLCGFFIFLGSTLQQVGLEVTTASKCGFVTSLYIVIVPLLSLFVGHKSNINVYIGVGLAVLGLYLLCMKENESIAMADILIVFAAICLACQIFLVGRFSQRVNPFRFTFYQFVFCSFFSLLAMFWFEDPTWSQIWSAALPILYVGVFTVGVAYTLQTWCQRDTEASVTALIFSLEAVFSAVCGYFILHEVLNTREIAGCFVIFVAVLLAQFPFKTQKSWLQGRLERDATVVSRETSCPVGEEDRDEIHVIES